MKPVLATVVSSSPAVWRPYAVASSSADADAGDVARAAAACAASSSANGASTTVEIAKRTARNANSG